MHSPVLSPTELITTSLVTVLCTAQCSPATYTLETQWKQKVFVTFLLWGQAKAGHLCQIQSLNLFLIISVLISKWHQGGAEIVAVPQNFKEVPCAEHQWEKQALGPSS